MKRRTRLETLLVCLALPAVSEDTLCTQCKLRSDIIYSRLRSAPLGSARLRSAPLGSAPLRFGSIKTPLWSCSGFTVASLWLCSWLLYGSALLRSLWSCSGSARLGSGSSQLWLRPALNPAGPSQSRRTRRASSSLARVRLINARRLDSAGLGSTQRGETQRGTANRGEARLSRRAPGRDLRSRSAAPAGARNGCGVTAGVRGGSAAATWVAAVVDRRYITHITHRHTYASSGARTHSTRARSHALSHNNASTSSN